MDLAKICGLGLLGVTTNQTLFLVGIHHTLPSRAVLIYAATPLAVLLIGRIRGTETVNSMRLAGIVAAVTGVIVLMTGQGALDAEVRLGDAAILVGMLAWSAYTALGKRLLMTYGALPVTCIALIAGGVAYIPIGLPAVLSTSLAEISVQGWLGIAWLVFFTSIASCVCWFFAIEHLPPTRVAIFINLQPPVTLFIAWGWFGEPMTAALLGGAAMVLSGVWLVQRGRPGR
jgi:drug/metabolite transporter (DMT)-like permease